MNPHEGDELREQVDRLERLVRDMAARLDRLEGRPPAEVKPGPPPFILPTPPPARVQTPGASWLEVTPDRPRMEPPRSPERDGASVDDMEYKIGMTGLLRGGAVIVVLALLYLVALAISNRWISITTQFIGEIVLCAGFIAVGQWKRTEREDFGQLLTGIGSCGLYFSFAGAHSFKHLYEGETLVLLFLAWSLVNLGYSYWQSSRTFLVIGLVGGLIGSVMPMQKDRTLMTAILHFLVILPTSVIIVRNRWNGLSALMWCLSVFALTPVFFSQEPWLTRMIAMYGSGLLACYVYARTFQESKFDSYATFLPFVAMVTAIGGMLLDHSSIVSSVLVTSSGTNPQHGSHQVLVLSALLGLMAYHLRSQKLVSGVLALTAVGIAAIMAPVGLARTPEAFTFFTISLALAGATVKLKSVPLSWLAWIVYGLGLLAYISPWSTDVFLASYETPFLLFAIAAAGVHSWANKQLGQESQAATLVASGLALPMILRLSNLWIARAWGNSEARAMFVGLGVFTLYSIALSYRRGWSGFVAVGYGGMIATLIAYNLSAKAPPLVETLMLVYVIALAISLPWVAKRSNIPEVNVQIGAVASLVAFMICRLSVIWLSETRLVALTAAQALGLLFSAHVGAILGKRFGWAGTVVVGWVTACLAAFLAFFSYDAMTLGIAAPETLAMQLGLLIASITAFLLCGYASKPFDLSSRTTEVSCAILILPLWSRIGHLVFTQFVGIKDAPAITASWIIYACITIALGFRFKIQALRFFSFAIFGLTIAKVMLFDLSGLDPGIRVVILLFLGLAMIVGGYVYIRAKAGQEKPD